MKYDVSSIEEYLKAIPEERKPYVDKIRKVILENIPDGFEEIFQYNMIGYAVPHSIYPDGYHCKPEEALPFANLASQKNFIALYNMGLYADPKVFKWFTEAYPKHCKRKLDMGKSCVRFKKMDDIPYELIGELMQKFTVESWIKLYEKNIKK